MKNKNVLITGGAGLIGSHLTDSLLSQGAKVVVVDNFITGNKDNLKQHEENENFELIEADVSEPTTVQCLTSTTYDYIFHFASPASPKGYQDNPIATYQVNSLGTHLLLKLAKDMNSRFIYSSTSEVYGDPKVHPQPETYWGNVNPNGIRSCYDESKRFGEMACMTFKREYNVDVRILRFFNTYGPRNDAHDGRVVPNLIMQAIQNMPMTIYGDGSQTRSFCYVSDLVKGIEKAAFIEDQSGLVVNLGNPTEFTIKNFANLIKKISGSNSEIIFKDLPADDPKQRQPDISKAKKLLDWEPTIDIEEGLKPTIEYFKSLI